jgi:hypothetical protein
MSVFNGGGITVRTPLQIVTSAYEQSQQASYIADRIFPNVPVRRRSGDFWKLNPADWLRNQVQKRAAGTIARRGGWRFQEGPLYRVVEYSAKIGVPRQDRREQMENGLPDPVTVNRRWVLSQLDLNRELVFASRYFATGVWDTEWTGDATPGADQFLFWDNAAATPIEDVGGFLDAIHAKTGLTPNTMVMPRTVARAARLNPQLIDAVRSPNRSDPTIMPYTAFFREAFEIENIIIVDSVYNTAGPMVETPTLAQIYGDTIGFFYVGGADWSMEPSAGHILSWSDNDTKSFITEGSQFFDMLSTSDQLGGLMMDVLT